MSSNLKLTLHKKFREARKEYLSKKKELSQKRLELK